MECHISRRSTAIEKINEEHIEIQGKLWGYTGWQGNGIRQRERCNFSQGFKEDEAATAQKMQPILADYIKMAKSKGLPGDEALKFVQDFLKKNP